MTIMIGLNKNGISGGFQNLSQPAHETGELC